MSHKRVFLQVLLALILCGSVVGFFSPKSQTVAHAMAPGVDPTSQASESRVWAEVKFVKDLVIGSHDDPLLVNPTMIGTDLSGHIFALDSDERVIREFSPDGVLIQDLRATNPETGGLLVPTHFDVSDSGDIAVCYQQDRLAQVFSPSGEIVRTVPTAMFPHRISIFPQSRLSIMHGLPGPDLFRRFRLEDIESGPDGAFGRILDGDIQHPLLLDGWTTVDRKRSRLIHAFRMAGLIAAYSSSGELDFIVETISPSPLPQGVSVSSSKQSVPPGTAINALAVSVTEGKIFVLNAADSVRSKNPIIDIYASTDGSYISSIRPPERAFHIAVSGNHLYILNRQQVSRWQMVGEGFAEVTPTRM